MKLRKNLSGRMAYKSFIPPSIKDFQYAADDRHLHELSALFKELGNKISALSEDDILQLVRMEAADSWRLAEDRPGNPFSFISGCDNNENIDNIVRATAYAADVLNELPLSTRLIRNIHSLICAGEDYDKKYRGEYRKSPVWIAQPGKGLQEATFVPPVASDMDAAIADLENYINYSEDNCFLKAAIFHYQFEMIHPFIDGNGRTGRLLNNIFLSSVNILSYPVLLLSHIIARDYNAYCAEIQRVNETGNIAAWIAYWFQTLTESARYTLRVIEAVMAVGGCGAARKLRQRLPRH